MMSVLFVSGIAAKQNTNLIPLFLDAMKVQVTLGEISNALRAVFGEYRSQE